MPWLIDSIKGNLLGKSRKHPAVALIDVADYWEESADQ